MGFPGCNSDGTQMNLRIRPDTHGTLAKARKMDCRCAKLLAALRAKT